MFYLAIILFGVGWILLSIIRNYVNNKSPISNKYLNHGTDVPLQKCYKFNKSVSGRIEAIPSGSKKCTVSTTARTTSAYSTTRTYSTLPSNPSTIVFDENNTNNSNSPVKVYEDSYSMRKDILKDTIGKSGIYMWKNKLTGDVYVGQSADIAKRLKNYYNLSYIKSKSSFIISRALIKYGYSNFSFTILEYCNKSDLLSREQHYFDSLNPEYNILKIAGSSKEYKHLEETRKKISKALKGVYTKENSSLFGRLHTEETKEKMSLKKAGKHNPLYGKTHSEDTKEQIKLKALGRKHSDETKLTMSAKHGNLVNVYEKCSAEGFKWMGSFVSARRAAKFLGMSGSTVIRYMQSGEIFKERYKFSSK